MPESKHVRSNVNLHKHSDTQCPVHLEGEVGQGHLTVFVCVCVRACVRACVRVCVCVCARACVRASE